MYSKPAIIGLFSFLMLFSVIPDSQAELWEFIVEANMEKETVYSGNTVAVTGKVVNHAYEPSRGVEILISAGTDTIKTFTDTQGLFRGEFVNFQKGPGTYTVNVIASWYGMTGLASTQFQVNGDFNPASALQQKLLTDEARKYLISNEADFEKDPIGQTLFRHYQKLLQQFINEKESQKPSEEQILIEQQRGIAENLKSQAITKFDPGTGTYGGYQYENYISSLNPEIRDLVDNQLNFTQNNFADAQKIRDEIIENGGTYEEARKAYLDRLAITKKTLEQFNEKYIEDSEKLKEEKELKEKEERELMEEEERELREKKVRERELREKELREKELREKELREETETSEE